MNAPRRPPVQKRSRARFEEILLAAEALVGEGGLAAMSTKAVAERSGIPTSTIYRYFTNSDDILSALLDRDMELINGELARAISDLESVDIRTLVELATNLHLHHNQAQPTTVELWFKGEHSPVVLERVRLTLDRFAAWFDAALRGSGLVVPSAPSWGARLIVRLANRMLEFALLEVDDPGERAALVRTFNEMIIPQVEVFATPAGREGISKEEFLQRLGEAPVEMFAFVGE